MSADLQENFSLSDSISTREMASGGGKGSLHVKQIYKHYNNKSYFAMLAILRVSN